MNDFLKFLDYNIPVTKKKKNNDLSQIIFLPLLSNFFPNKSTTHFTSFAKIKQWRLRHFCLDQDRDIPNCIMLQFEKPNCATTHTNPTNPHPPSSIQSILTENDVTYSKNSTIYDEFYCYFNQLIQNLANNSI